MEEKPKPKMGFLKKVIVYGGGFFLVTVLVIAILIKLTDDKRRRGDYRNTAAISPVVTTCNNVKSYFRKSQVQYQSKGQAENSAKLFETGEIKISGPGIISSKPISFICSSDSGITLFGIDIKVNKNQTQQAAQTLLPIINWNTIEQPHRNELKAYFNEKMKTATASSYSDWVEQTFGKYKLRLHTVQADANRNFFLTLHLEAAR